MALDIILFVLMKDIGFLKCLFIHVKCYKIVWGIFPCTFSNIKLSPPISQAIRRLEVDSLSLLLFRA